MSSSLRVNTIVPSTGTNVAIGTANGTVTFTDSVNFVLGTGSSIFSPASNTLTFGTNDAERLRIDFCMVRVGINQASPGAMLQVDYDEGNSQVALRLRAYNASGSKTWQLSEINGNAGVFTIRNATNSQNILNIDGVNQRVGVNNTSPDHKVSVYDAGYCGLELKSNRSTATDNIGGLHFKTQSTNVAYIQSLVDGTINFRNTSSLTERLRITSGGDVNIGPAANANGHGLLTLSQSASAAFNALVIQQGNTAFTATDGLQIGIDAGVHAYIKQYENRDIYFTTGNPNTEKLRLTSSGDVGIGDNAPNSNYGTNLSVHSTATDGARLKLSDGTSGKGNTDGFDLISTGGVAYMLNRENADMSFSTNNTERMRLYANGKLHLGNSHIASNNLTRLHVGWNTGGTVAGESIIAGTLGNDTSAVSALLTMKNAGNRGAQGASGGSSLAKFEFNNGTAFEIDKYGRRTLPYQPGCKLTIDTNSQGGGNHAQTGRTILPFNSTGFGYNTGNHYNLTTHTFTAPLAGKYLVILSVNVIGDNIAYIYKNGSIHSAGEFRSNPTGVWEHIEISTVVECSANDTIQPYSQMTGSGRKFNGGNQPGSYWDTFTIYFLG